MKLDRILRKEKVKSKYPKEDVVVLYLTKNEALEIIESLSKQIRTDDCNSGRPEYLGIFGNIGKDYFSIIVDNNLATKR